MRKRSSYRPKGLRLDNMTWLKAGFMPVGRVPTAGIHLKISNMSALDALTLGQGTGTHSHTLREALEMALHLTTVNPDLGADLTPELQQPGCKQEPAAYRGRDFHQAKHYKHNSLTDPDAVPLYLGQVLHDPARHDSFPT